MDQVLLSLPFRNPVDPVICLAYIRKNFCQDFQDRNSSSIRQVCHTIASFLQGVQLACKEILICLHPR